jgi:hypothetical protein
MFCQKCTSCRYGASGSGFDCVISAEQKSCITESTLRFCAPLKIPRNYSFQKNSNVIFLENDVMQRLRLAVCKFENALTLEFRRPIESDCVAQRVDL